MVVQERIEEFGQEIFLVAKATNGIGDAEKKTLRNVAYRFERATKIRKPPTYLPSDLCTEFRFNNVIVVKWLKYEIENECL